MSAFWLEVLKNDQRAIFTAAGHAQKAAEFLLATSESRADHEEPDRLAARAHERGQSVLAGLYPY